MKDYLISVGLCRLPKGKLWSVCPFPAAWVGEDWRGRFRVFHFIFWRLIMWIAHLPCFLSASSSHLPYHTELTAWDCWEMKCNVQCWCNIWAPNMKPYILIFFIKISFLLIRSKSWDLDTGQLSFIKTKTGIKSSEFTPFRFHDCMHFFYIQINTLTEGIGIISVIVL